MDPTLNRIMANLAGIIEIVCLYCTGQHNNTSLKRLTPYHWFKEHEKEESVILEFNDIIFAL